MVVMESVTMPPLYLQLTAWTTKSITRIENRNDVNSDKKEILDTI